MTTEHSYGVPVWRTAESPGIELGNDLEYIGQQFEFDGAFGNNGKYPEVDETFGPRFPFVASYPCSVESSLTRRAYSVNHGKQVSHPGTRDIGYQDSTYGSLSNDDTQSCMSFSNNLAPAIEQFLGSGGYSSCSREQLVPTGRSSIRCDLCNWEGKLLSEKRFGIIFIILFPIISDANLLDFFFCIESTMLGIVEIIIARNRTAVLVLDL